MIKDIVVNLSVGGPHDVAGDYAVSVAAAFQAHVAAIAFSYEAVVPGMLLDGGIPVSLVESQRRASDKAAQDAIARFDRAAGGVVHSREVRLLNTTLSEAGQKFGSVARRFDLAIVGQSESGTADDDEFVIEGALFDSGRPVILVPCIQKKEMKLDRITICWDGSRAATRAIADALPFLRRSKAIELLMVEDPPSRTDEAIGADMAQHLARHGLAVEVNRISSVGIDVSDAILSHLADSSSDFVVMGGYGHSRLREFVLGGVTRAMLKTMLLPTLISH
jgi:nucleotide-binding universal stress UspA family protein